MYYFEVTFYDGFGTSSRILEVYDIQINTGTNIDNLLKREDNYIKDLASKYYAKYCRIHKLKVNKCSLLNQEQLSRYSKDTPVDRHSYANDFYHYKATMYVEKYGIVSYKIIDKHIVYNQNYYNKEFIKGKWINRPCTYQRIVDLDTGKTESKQLKRLQKDGWNNV